VYVGLARTIYIIIYIRYIYGMFGIKITNVRSFTVCIYTVLANPTCVQCAYAQFDPAASV
jgi:hypothetical protein